MHRSVLCAYVGCIQKCVRLCTYVIEELLNKPTPWLMDPDSSCHIHKDFPVIPMSNQVSPVPCIDTYLFKIYSNIFLSARPGLSQWSLSLNLSVKILKAILPLQILDICTAHLNLSHLVIQIILGEW